MRRFSIHIPQPCPQSWDDMHPNDRGRYCASCQKTVVDYTALSDRELIKQLARPTSEMRCGRLRDDQLNRLLIADTAGHSWHYWISLLTMGWLGLQTAQGQQPATKSATAYPTPASPVQPSFVPIVRADHPLTSNHSVPLTISGRVLLYDTGAIVRPVANAYVNIGRFTDGWHTKTDSTGAFSLVVTSLNQPTTFNVWASAAPRLHSSYQLQTKGTETTIELSDTALAVYSSRPMVDVTGGGIAILHMPSRWQRFWRGLLHRQPRQNG